jgi:hypothetical protein
MVSRITRIPHRDTDEGSFFGLNSSVQIVFLRSKLEASRYVVGRTADRFGGGALD